ncbi:DUF5719 family protein [Agromyces sp. NPDC058126]|uniref:DUF5719 family protein n=1 Tax=Agromyces sp. NPDC058126 TaxID=3346350 RepID=UPI0036DA95B5
MADKRELARNVARAGGRGLALVLAGGIAAAALAAAALVPWPEFRVEPPSTVVEPAETGQLRVCPGPLLSLGDDAADATTAVSVGSTSVTTGVSPDDVEITETPLGAPENPNADRDGTPLAITTEAGAAGAGELAGAQGQRSERETIAGFAAAACDEAVAEAWLVGGATDVGRSSIVLLSNPSEVAATVDVRVSGENGPVEAPSALGITVPAGEQRVLSLAGLAPNLRSPVVHVTSTGGAIAATLEHSVIEGLTPAGVELVGPTAMPATTQLIPGFVVPTAGGVDPADDHAEGDDHPAVRLFAPGDEPVEVSIGVASESGGGGAGIDVSLEPGQVTDVPLGELDEGDYTITLEADAPIVAAARATTGTPQAQTAPGGDDEESSVDLAWTVATAPLLDDAVVAVPRGPGPVLHLLNPGDEELEVLAVVDGEERVVRLAPEEAASIELEQRSVVELGGADGVHATVSFSGERALSSFPVRPPGPLDSPIVVTPR